GHAVVDAAGTATERRAVTVAGTGDGAGHLRPGDGGARFGVPGRVRGRDPDRRPAGPVQAGDRTVPLLAREPRRDRGVRAAGPDGPAAGPAGQRRAVDRPRVGGAAGVRGAPARGRAAAAAGETDRRGA